MTKSSPHNYLEHACQLQYNKKINKVRLTGIICTIGPATKSVDMMVKLMSAGMNIARLNFSHGTHEYHAETVNNLRKAVEVFSKKIGYNYFLGIALDTKGPEIRTGLIEGKATNVVELKKGGTITLTTNTEFKDKGSVDKIFVDYMNMPKILKPKNRIFVDDGLISLIVKEIKDKDLVCEIENDGQLGSSKGVNLPGIDVDLPNISEKEQNDFKFAIKHKLDFIFASFIRNAENIEEIRCELGEEGKSIKIVAKIENHQGMDNIGEIIEASDGVMAARGDLGIEIPAEKVFTSQKIIFAQCMRAGKPGICATQMLESMIKKPRPTRAELSDVANAVLDGADCVMLSGETAKGDYPVECVKTMVRVCKEAESSIWYENLFLNICDANVEKIDNERAMIMSVVNAAITSGCKAIIVFTSSGYTSVQLSRHRPPCPILSFIEDNDLLARQSHLYRSIATVPYKPKSKDSPLDERLELALGIAKKARFVKEKDTVIVVTSLGFGGGITNSMRMVAVP